MNSELQALIDKYGINSVRDSVAEYEEQTFDLTIISNAGLHRISQDVLKGDVYEFTSGNIVLNSQDEMKKGLKEPIEKLAEKLNERLYKNIYLVPTGPAVLALLIKNIVYTITRINSIDLVYTSGQYFYFDYNYRIENQSKKAPQSDV